VYEGRGATGLALTDAVRASGSDTPLERLVVADVGDNRRLTQLLLGELKAQDVPARSVSASRLRLLREAPRAALVVELGSALVDADVTRLSEDEGRREMAVALARSVASFLAAQAAKAGGS
jgi:N-acetylmuramoyl-L-alanine amidase